MAGHMYIKFEGPNIEGESTAKGHEKEIEVLNWSHGFSQSSNITRSGSGGATAGHANHMDFGFMKQMDTATDQILKGLWSGQHYDKATVTCYRAEGATDNSPAAYLTIEMTDLIITSYNTSTGGEIPTESISINYGSVKYIYDPTTTSDGSTTGKRPIKHDLVNKTIE